MRVVGVCFGDLAHPPEITGPGRKHKYSWVVATNTVMATVAAGEACPSHK